MEKSYLNHFSRDRASEIYTQVIRLLQMKRLYRDPNTSARSIAQEIGCNSRDISAAISISTEGNFLQLLGKIRSQEAARMLRDLTFLSATTEEIGLQCGFASRQSFHNAFKKSWGMTPHQYRTQYHAR